MRKKHLLLHHIREEAPDIYHDLPEPTDEDLPDNPTEYDKVKAKLNKRFTPMVSKTFEQFEVDQMKKRPDESVDDFYS